MFEQVLIKADIDAGSGHLLLQLGLALLAGSLFYIRSITEWFRGDKKEPITETYSAPAPSIGDSGRNPTQNPSHQGQDCKATTTTKARSKKTARTSSRRRAS
jgi:hypothetical protein